MGTVPEKRPPRIVVVTGASAGVGRAIARAFARCRWSVALLARGDAGLEGARRDVESLGGRALVCRCDVADDRQVELAAERVEAELGPIDVWINNAIFSVFSPADRMTAEGARDPRPWPLVGLLLGQLFIDCDLTTNLVAASASPDPAPYRDRP